MDDSITETEPNSPVFSSFSGSELTLAELTQLSAKDLYTLFRHGRTPQVEELEGAYRGLQLATATADVFGIRQLNRWLSDSVLFPWQGKSFRSLGDGEGEGNNQVLGGRKHVFRFKTYLAPSRLGDFETFQLDYGQPGNPFGVHQVRDELREISPGIYLGLIFWQLGRKSIPLAFFALAQTPPDMATIQRHRRQKTLLTASVGTLLASWVTWRLVKRRFCANQRSKRS